MFEKEITRLQKKLDSGLVSSIWMQFGTDITLLESRIEILNDLISSSKIKKTKGLDISLFGSILFPTKQFLSRFKYRPWKGVYCSPEFLESVDYANKIVSRLIKTYNISQVMPLIETNISNVDQLKLLNMIL
tara:strand:- start:1798 stop:2193 length:396 start_codon:yes stop_codon:yes gene_type:complete